MARQLLNGDEFNQALGQLADKLAENLGDVQALALVGIRSGGDILARRLSGLLEARGLRVEAHGLLDITLYRDDLDEVGGRARVQATEIDFDVSKYVIVLVDDVLFTGRTARAALDAMIDLGRPKAIRLAVLVDRGDRELPIHADFAAVTLEQTNQHVQVKLKETDGVDEVLIK